MQEGVEVHGENHGRYLKQNSKGSPYHEKKAEEKTLRLN